jgi:hypothetical protein
MPLAGTAAAQFDWRVLRMFVFDGLLSISERA